MTKECIMIMNLQYVMSTTLKIRGILFHCSTICFADFKLDWIFVVA